MDHTTLIFNIFVFLFSNFHENTIIFSLSLILEQTVQQKLIQVDEACGCEIPTTGRVWLRFIVVFLKRCGVYLASCR